MPYQKPRFIETTLRDEVLRLDEQFVKESSYVTEYEFNGGKRIFKAYYKNRGAYSD